MLARNLLYFSYLSLFAAPYLLAGSFQEKQEISSNILAQLGINKREGYLLSKYQQQIYSDSISENYILNDRSVQKYFKFTKVAEFKKNSSSKSIEDTLKINKENFSNWNAFEVKETVPSDIEWIPVEGNEILPADINWTPIDIKDLPVFDTYQNSKNDSKRKFLHEKLFDFKLLRIGKAVPTSETLSQGELRLNVGQVSPIASGYAKGTGNQNYIGAIDYGFHNNILISLFYTDADDPLTKRIVILDTQPENRWSSYGSAIKWKFLEKNKFKFSIEGSIENWMVQSGGCSGNECSANTSNIFNSNTSMVENNNLVGAISLPIGLKYSSKLDFNLTPKITFLPESQSNQYGEGDFYGNNYGIGFGMAYKVINRLKTFTSYYFPLGDSKNSFDDELNFSKTSIYTLGMNYSIDSRTNFQAFLTNGFGLSPATSVLTIPSSDEILYGFNIIYTPTEIDNYYYLMDERSSSRKFFNGLSVSNNSYINSDDTQLNILYDADGSWHSRYEKALSQRFIVDLTASGIDRGTDTNTNFISYFKPGNTIVRGGAKALLYTNKDRNLTSSFRGSFGRVLAENKNGYFFGESINSYNLLEKVSLNINPKIGFTGSGESIGLGTGIHWKVLKQITLISETNIPINNAENNMTFGIRYSPKESNKHIDLYSSNALSFIDMGQLMKRNKNVLGVNLGIVF